LSIAILGFVTLNEDRAQTGKAPRSVFEGSRYRGHLFQPLETSFSDKLRQEKNLPRYLKNIDNIKTLYSEIEKEIEKDKAQQKNILAEVLPTL
jgi:hypothetical protein